jgi:hypothetical protein
VRANQQTLPAREADRALALRGRARGRPNDAVPHQDRRELRASRLLAAWIGHHDARSMNTLALWADDGDHRPRRRRDQLWVADNMPALGIRERPMRLEPCGVARCARVTARYQMSSQGVVRAMRSAQAFLERSGVNPAEAEVLDAELDYHEELLLEPGTLVDHGARFSRITRVTFAGPQGPATSRSSAGATASCAPCSRNCLPASESGAVHRQARPGTPPGSRSGASAARVVGLRRPESADQAL